MNISIIIPYVYDRGFLNEAIKSIYEQTYPIEKIQIILSKSDNGVSTNFNNGLNEVTTDLVRYLCDDDLLTTNSVEDTINYFKNNNVDFIHSNAYNFYEDGSFEEYIPKIKIPTLQDMLNKYMIHGGTVTYKTSCFNNRRFDEELWTGEEYDFNLWLLKNNYKIGYLNSFTYKYRRHKLQKSLGNDDKIYQQKRQIEKDKIKQRYL